MADLLADPVKETWRQMAANDPTGVESLAPKQIDPNAQIKLAARDKAADPFAGLDEVKNDAFAGLEEVKTQDAFSGLQPADSLDVKDTQSLVDDDTFRPADYLAANPNLRTDAEKSKKLIDVYRARQIRGLQAGKVLKAAATEAPGIVAKTVKGVRDLGARIIETGIQPAATSVLATLTGASVEEKAAIMAEQGKEQLKAVGEVTAGTEAAVTGLAQLGQQGVRKLFGKSPEKMSDSELLDQLYLDSEFSKTIAEVAEGRGDAVKAAGLDADTLAKNGVILDKEAIEHLSLVDPVTLVATAGAFKVVGLGGRVLATAANRAGAQAVITGLGNLVKTAGSKSVEAAGKTAEVIGKTVQPIAERLPAKSVGFVLGATKTGTLQGGAIGAAAGEAAKRIGVETASALAKRGARVAELGGQLNPSFIGPRSAGLSRLLSLPSTTAGQIATRTAGGAVQGAVTALPLVAASDDSQTAGALLGGGIALGAIHGVAAGGKAAIAETVAKNYLDPHNIPFEKTNSPGYGVDVKLDALHDAAIAKLPEHEQNAVNAFREAVRAGGGEIYVQDGKSYGERVRENQIAENGGKPLTPEQEAQAALYTSTHAFFDGMIPDANGEARRVVFLNSDSTGIHHDSGHLFQALLSPENQAALRESALSSYSKEQIQAFKDEYARRIGEPDYFDKLGDQADFKAADELIAENFGQLFQNKTFADLSAPRSFLKKLSDTAIQAGEALGFDLTAGRTTADLGAKPSFRLQDLLRNAAQDVLTREPKTPAAPVEPPKLKMVEPADVKPVEVAPVKITPAEVLPKEPVSPIGEKPVVSETSPSTAKNIRAERASQSDFATKRAEETGISEAQKATESDPATRKTVDTIAESMQRGNPVLEIEHLGIVSERGPAAPEGRTSRRGTQEAGYQELERLQIENRAEAPADIVDLHQKTFVPVRFTTQGGKPTLIAMSLDKVIANVRKVVGDAVANKAESLLPYPVENGKLTDAGWKQAISDVQAYAENQSNGFRGDGQKLVRPTEDIGVSLPAENPNYTPKTLSEGAMNFSNLVQGLNPPETGRVQKGLTPGNIKGQLLAEINKKQPMTPAVIKPENVTKQAFKGFEPRTVKETNPLRNELAARGVKVRELLEVTERLAVKDIASVKPRADIAFKAPVTDIIRSGFLPRTVEELAKIQRGEQDGQTFNLDGSIFSPGDQKLDVVTLASKNIPLSELSPKVLSDFLAQYPGAEKNPSIKPGVFRLSGGPPRVSLDLNVLVDQSHRDNTVKFARDNQQQAIFDLANLSSVETGGTGETILKSPHSIERAAENLVSGKPVEVARLAKEKPVSELGPEIQKMSPEDWKSFTEEGGGSLTRRAYELGLGLKDKAHLEQLRQFQADFDQRAKSAVQQFRETGSDVAMQEASLNGLKSQFFREATEAATDTGSAANPRMGWRRVMPDAKPPFAEPKAEATKFLPRTEAGKKAVQDGVEFEMTGDIGNRSIRIKKGGVDVGDVTSSSNSFTGDLSKAIIAGTNVQKSLRGKGIGEAAYRELLTQLKEDGVTEVGGMTVSGAPIVIREKVFGKGSTKIQDVGGSERGTISVEQALAELNDGGLGFEASNKITPEMKFLPGKEDRAVSSAAVEDANGRIYTGRYHGEAIDRANLANASKIEGYFDPSWDVPYKVGFVTNEGEFLSRQDAFSRAKELNQVPKEAEAIDPDEPHTRDFRKAGAFLPRTKAGKELAKKGFDFQLDESSDKTGFVVRAVNTAGEDVGRLEFTVDNFGNSELKDIFVNPDQRQQGIGSTLYKEMADYLQEQEVTRNTGEIISPGAVKRRKEVLPTTTFRDSDGERLTVSEALENADSGLSVYAESYVPKTTKFLPKRRNVEESDIAPKKKTAAKAPKAGSATGWILPNQEFVPLNDAFHENFLATNADSLNTKFGTKFASTPDVDARKDALNKGFVRIRYTPATGAAMVELNARYWTPKTRQALMKQLEGRLDSIDKLQVSLLNDKGGVIDAMSAGRFDMEAPERLTAFEEGLSGLRGGSAKFLPKLPNRKDYGYVGDVQDGEVRAAAVNLATKTHSEMGLESMWRYNPLTKKVYWWDTAERNAHSDLVKEELEAAGHEVVGNRMVTTDISTYNEAHANSEKYPARDYFRNTKFLPSETGTLPGLKMPSQQDRVKSRIAKAKNSFPEALPPRYEKDDAGKFVMDEDGKPKPILEDYRFDETPVAREAAKGLRGDSREDAITTALGDKLVKAAKVAQKNPDIAAGVTWYSTARSRLKKLLGDDSKFFSELLGATSARTPVETNFRFALDAYNEFKRGNYNAILKKYREGKDRWESGEVEGFSTRAAFLDSWVQENNLTPLQSNGKKFAMNSQAVLKVLDGSWAEEVGGPKTPNFAGNLSGQTFEATLDVWASRLIHRLANEGNDKPWRILPENETGLSDADFALGQKIFRAAARKLAMKPDALQAILWFAEKDHWEKNGWTRGAGAEKSDFNVLLKETELTPAGILRRKTPQKEFDLGLSEDDIKSKNK